MTSVEDLLSSLECFRTITVSAQNPFAKTMLLALIVKSKIDHGKKVSYIDFDLQFSSLVSVLKNSSLGSSYLALYCAATGSVVDSIVSVLSPLRNNTLKQTRGEIVVLDSVNTLQLLLREEDGKIDALKANHETGILLSLLQDHSSKNGGQLITTNIIRSRPIEVQGTKLWGRDIAGGRMIRSKSDAILYASAEEYEMKGKPKELKVEISHTSHADARRPPSSFALEIDEDFILK